MVRRVERSSGAADAGIRPGDVIIATGGKSVMGIDSNEMTRERLAGPAGTSIELSVVQADGMLKKMMAARKPYPVHLNPPTDGFSYVIPGIGRWTPDTTFRFPGLRLLLTKDSKICLLRRVSMTSIRWNITAT